MKIDIDTKDLLELMEYQKKAPKKYAAASQMWLNRAAFTSRANMLRYMQSHMTIRNAGFVSSRLRVQKARGSRIASQQATVGSIRTPRHTGWAEQEGLRPDKRDKTIAVAARGNNARKRVRPGYRMRRGKKRPKPIEYHGRKREHRVVNMLRTLGREGYRGAFVITGHPKFRSGLYRLGRGKPGEKKIIPLQIFRERPKKTKREPWMTSSTDLYFRTINRRRVWSDILRRVRANERR